MSLSKYGIDIGLPDDSLFILLEEAGMEVCLVNPKTALLHSYMRDRDSIIKERRTFVKRMQKALTKLLHNVIDDITGKTVMQVITAIPAGERDLKHLASFRDPH